MFRAHASQTLHPLLRNVRLLYLHNFLNDFCFQYPFMVIYFQQIAGSYVAAMGVLAIERISAALFDVPTGMFSDHAGRKFTIAAGSLCATLGVVSYALAHDFALLALGGALSGLARCLFSGNNNALLYESLKAEGLEKKFHHYQGRAGGMFQLALCLSAFLSALLTPYGLRFIFVLSVVPQFLTVILSFFFREPKKHQETPPGGFAHLKHACLLTWRNKKLRLLVLAQAISYGVGESTFNFKTAFASLFWPIWAIGVFRGINHALGFAGFMSAGKLVDKIHPARLLVWVEIYWAVQEMIALLLYNVLTPVMMAFGALAYGPHVVARDHLLQSEFSDAQRATLGSVASFMGSIFYALAAVAMGALSDRAGLAYGLGFSILAELICLPMFIRLFRRHF